jgi:gamma-glutamylcyclotransferase (GGCT)/AIG2-like uncharacterized protein YtfP
MAPEAQGRARTDAVTAVLFVYGTLAPDQDAWSLLAPHVTHVTENAVPGILYDTGRGYPGAVFTDAKGLVRGWCCALADAPLEQLDAFEGDEYERVEVCCVDGTEAQAYEWVASLACCRAVPDGTWARRRHADTVR